MRSITQISVLICCRRRLRERRLSPWLMLAASTKTVRAPSVPGRVRLPPDFATLSRASLIAHLIRFAVVSN